MAHYACKQIISEWRKLFFLKNTLRLNLLDLHQSLCPGLGMQQIYKQQIHSHNFYFWLTIFLSPAFLRIANVKCKRNFFCLELIEFIYCAWSLMLPFRWSY